MVRVDLRWNSKFNDLSVVVVEIFYSHADLWPIREKELQAQGSDKERSKFSCLQRQ